MIGEYIARRWPRSAWYAGRLGQTVSSKGCRITAISRWQAGLLRLGSYEAAEQVAVERFLDRDRPLIELGVGIGLIACLANRRLRNRSQHLCVDGNPDALSIASLNGSQNGCGFATLHAALAYDTTTVTFGADEEVLDGGINSGHRPITAPTVTLAQLFGRTGFPECSLICDIEGADAAMIDREGDLIQERVRLIILESHPRHYGADTAARLSADLEKRGFTRQWRQRDVSVFKR
jgi:FkbM family methyltransferase